MLVIINTITSILQALTYFSTSVVVTYTSYQFINYLIRKIKFLINKTKYELINIINQELKLKESVDQELNKSLDLDKEINDEMVKSMDSESPDSVSSDDHVYVPISPSVPKNNFVGQNSYQHGLTIGPVTYAPFVSEPILGTRLNDGNYITATGELSDRMFFGDPHNFIKPETKSDEVERKMRERMDQYSFHVANGNRTPIPTEINFALDGSDTRRKLNESETYRTNIPNIFDVPRSTSSFLGNNLNYNQANHTFKNDDIYIPTYGKMSMLNDKVMRNSMMMTNGMMNHAMANDIGTSMSTRRISNPSFDLRGDPAIKPMTGLQGNTMSGP